MYLQIKSARVYAAYSQGSGFGVACSQMEGSPRELCLHYQIKESSQRRQNSSHLFLKKSLYFIFNLGTVISQFSLLGESVSGRYDNHIFLSPKELPPFPKPYSSLESSTTSSLAALSGVLQSLWVLFLRYLQPRELNESWVLCWKEGVIFSTFNTLCLSKTAGFCEQDVKSLGFFLCRTVVQLKERETKKMYIPSHFQT